MKHTIFLVALLIAGCGREVPEFYSLDSAFSEHERETIHAAVQAWCDATGDCPEFSLWSERGRFVLVDDLEERDMAECPEGRTCAVGGRNNGDIIRIARNRPNQDSLSALWVVAAHEWGHFCTEHIDEGLMGALQTEDTPMVVDAASVDAWHAGCP